MSDNKKGKFGLGLLIGTVIGGLSAFFLSPKSGPENREEAAKKVKLLRKKLEEAEIDKKVKEIFGEATEDLKTLYVKAKDLLINGLAELKETVENIDKEKYMAVVDDVVEKIRKEFKKDAKQLEKLKKQLMKEWEKLRK